MAGLPWIKVWTEIGNHPKVQRLEKELGVPDALGIVIRLWCWTAAYHPDGDIPDSHVDAMGRAAKGELDLGVTPVTLGCVTAGFLEPIPGGYRVHDWRDIQEVHVEAAEKRKAQARERQRKFREKHSVTDQRDVTRDVTRDKSVTSPSPSPSFSPSLSPSEYRVKGIDEKGSQLPSQADFAADLEAEAAGCSTRQDGLQRLADVIKRTNP